jgi:hypothetical protein
LADGKNAVPTVSSMIKGSMVLGFQVDHTASRKMSVWLAGVGNWFDIMPSSRKRVHERVEKL